ncbi:hypothetical protein [Burkholderia cepacia]|uniref:hypothetical protein n=1 Tax=Burkholderia cepacia TaxID=292 RepID=UPI001FC85AF3|nr:hypothetical protein [Burkholderia cepacia]
MPNDNVLTDEQREQLELIERCQPDLLLMHIRENTAFDVALCERVFELAKERARALLAAHPGQPEPRAEVTNAARDVLAERRRQVDQEGWTPAHDDQYRDHELSCAAGCYAMYTLAHPAGDPPPAWPWAANWWKPTTHRRNLVKAGALIQAAIERLDRTGEPQ